MDTHSKLPAVTARRWAYLAIRLGRPVVVAAGAGVSSGARPSSAVAWVRAASLRSARRLACPGTPDIGPYLWRVPLEPTALPARALAARASTIRSNT
jgi:hypothetical protein